MNGVVTEKLKGLRRAGSLLGDGAMMIKFLTVIIAGTMCPLAAQAQYTNFVSGNELYAACVSTNDVNKGLCLGYVEGNTDMFTAVRSNAKRPDCVPDTVVPQQLVDIVTIYLRDHPATRNDSGTSQVIAAVVEAFKCAP